MKIDVIHVNRESDTRATLPSLSHDTDARYDQEKHGPSHYCSDNHRKWARFYKVNQMSNVIYSNNLVATWSAITHCLIPTILSYWVQGWYHKRRHSARWTYRICSQWWRHHLVSTSVCVWRRFWQVLFHEEGLFSKDEYIEQRKWLQCTCYFKEFILVENYFILIL